MQRIMWLGEIHKEDVAKVGGKGANLGEMFNAGFNVPKAFVVTTDMYFDFMGQKGLVEPIRELLEKVDVNNSFELNAVSEMIANLFDKTVTPLDMQKEIGKAYHTMTAGQMSRVAVRSSATAEDQPDASFAGQQATFLNVTEVLGVNKAVKACWASLFTPRAIFYRVQHGYDHFTAGVAVVVQTMIQSKVSGVMFTVDPATSDNTKMVIEAVWGLGEGIVSGKYTPDTYTFNRVSGQVDNISITRQEKCIAGTEGGPHEIMVKADWQIRMKLSLDQILGLAKMGVQAEDHYGKPQDIEWALCDDKLYMLQTRPITTLDAKAKPSEDIGYEIITEEAVNKIANEIISDNFSNNFSKGAKAQPSAPEKENHKCLATGVTASKGIAKGKVVVVKDATHLDDVKKGDVMVTETTDPDYVPAMKRASAIITNTGGRTCHAAIVSRELGIPCIVNTKNGTTVLTDGMMVEVNATEGKVYGA